MKKIIYTLILTLVVVSGLVFANREKENSKKITPKPAGSAPISAAEMKAARAKWEASPDGIFFKKWEASPAGVKVNAATAKISKSVKDFAEMEAVVTSLSLPAGGRLGFGVMVEIDNEDYILAFGIEQPGKNIMNFKSEFEHLRSLKVNDKIIIKSHNLSKAPKYAYPIVSGDYVERGGKIIYKRTPRKGGC
jgi:hypothetical protein